MVLVSCAKIDIVSDTQNSRNENVEIVFSAHVGKGLMTKSVINTTKLPDGSEFGVYSYFESLLNEVEDKEFVDTVKVTLNANTVGTESVDVMYAITNGEHHQEVNKLDNSYPDKYRQTL